MRTPAASEAERGHQPEEKSKARGGQVTLSGQMMTYFPTPMSRDYKGDTAPHKRDGKVQVDSVERAIFHSGEVQLPTPTASDWKGANHSGSGSASSRGIATVVEQTNWGKFQPAIKRWEKTLGRPAPAPTQPDGKNGAPRLSPFFTEWMMGLDFGWVTDCGLTRNESLKACGNGVVPQQAELALRVLLEGLDFNKEKGKNEAV
jgi:DNA (cytosine-5)-methyltransferase 1